jgi:hypothetical protein
MCVCICLKSETKLILQPPRINCVFLSRSNAYVDKISGIRSDFVHSSGTGQEKASNLAQHISFEEARDSVRGQILYIILVEFVSPINLLGLLKCYCTFASCRALLLHFHFSFRLLCGLSMFLIHF